MNNWQDRLTASIKLATDILFVKNPVGTSMGIFLGIILHGLVSLLAPLIASIKYLETSSLNLAHYMAVGIFGFNIRSFKSRHKISPEIEEAFNLIKQMEQSKKITKVEAKEHYRVLIGKVVANTQLNIQTQEQLPSS